MTTSTLERSVVCTSLATVYNQAGEPVARMEFDGGSWSLVLTVTEVAAALHLSDADLAGICGRDRPRLLALAVAGLDRAGEQAVREHARAYRALGNSPADIRQRSAMWHGHRRLQDCTWLAACLSNPPSEVH